MRKLARTVYQTEATNVYTDALILEIMEIIIGLAIVLYKGNFFFATVIYLVFRNGIKHRF